MGAKLSLFVLAAGAVGLLCLRPARLGLESSAPVVGPMEGPVEGPVEEPVGEHGEGHMPAVLAEARFDYRDDHGPARIVAEVQCRLERGADGVVRLLVVPSASGPLVDPIPGFRGVRGHNHRTALELERVESEGVIELVTSRVSPMRDEDCRESSVTGAPERLGAEAARSRTGRLAERRRTAAGKIEHDVLGPARVVAVELATTALAPGDWESTVVVRGRPRLAIDYTFDGERGEILAVRNVAESKETQP